MEYSDTYRLCPMCGTENTIAKSSQKTESSSKRYVSAYVNLPKQTRRGIEMEQVQLEGTQGMTIEQVRNEVAKGGKFVKFTYTMSFIFLTLQRPSGSIYFIKSNESPIDYGMKYLLLSVLVGWWGIPFGPIFTIVSIVQAFKGQDITAIVMASLSEELDSMSDDKPQEKYTENLDVNHHVNQQESRPLIQETPKPIEAKSPERIYSFRNIYDENNVKRYNTLSFDINDKFLGILFHNFPEAKIEAKVQPSAIAESAPWYAMPINFLLTIGEKRVAVLLVEGSKSKRYSVLETMELCKENGIAALRFFVEMPNEKEYVIKRIKEAL